MIPSAVKVVSRCLKEAVATCTTGGWASLTNNPALATPRSKMVLIQTADFRAVINASTRRWGDSETSAGAGQVNPGTSKSRLEAHMAVYPWTDNLLCRMDVHNAMLQATVGVGA